MSNLILGKFVLVKLNYSTLPSKHVRGGHGLPRTHHSMALVIRYVS